MIVRALASLLLTVTLSRACDCVTQPAKQAKRAAEVVFRGTIIDFRGSGSDRIVVFRVSTVWKGNVRQTFDMPAIEGDLCYAFLPRLLKVGNELIVYARKINQSSGGYFPLVCNTLLARNTKDIGALGPGNAPRK
jgi:hypothetical protein